ncbi:MAG: elongation factor P hydroxylase [Pseudomonadota bacterium]
MSRAACIEAVFNGCFQVRYRTRLQGGAAEPLYLPAAEDGEARIFYREDYPASALHEIAHWCIAGPSRRRQQDYGYWYAPDGRSAPQQRAFERVECRPQALEWHFALAAGLPFRISLDNLSSADINAGEFAAAVVKEAQVLCQRGLPERAGQFRASLAATLGGAAIPAPALFNTEALSR